MPTSTHAEYTDCTKIFGEFAAAQWADVGIGPYKRMGKYGTNSPKDFWFCGCLLLDLSVSFADSSSSKGSLGVGDRRTRKFLFVNTPILVYNESTKIKGEFL